MLFLATLGLDAQAQSASLPTITCGTDSGSIFNTAFDGTARMTSGTDPNWQVEISTTALTSAPATGYVPATVVSSPTAFWYTGFANANWIAASATGNQSVNYDVFYRIDFTLDSSVAPSEFAPSMNFYADNSVWEVYVNGVAQSSRGVAGLPQNATNPYGYVGYTQANAAQITLPYDWQSGTNTLIVQVKSASPQYGFQATFAVGTSACAANRAPTATTTLTGTPATGSTVTGSYTYADTEGDLENQTTTGTTYRFVTSSTNDLATSTDATTVANGPTQGNPATYAIPTADAGLYLFFCVTPAALTGSSPGLEACSLAAGPIVLQGGNSAPAQAVPVLSTSKLMLLALLAALLGAANWHARRALGVKR